MLQSSDKCPSNGSSRDTFVENYLTMLDRPFFTIFLELKSKVKVTKTLKQNVTLRDPMINDTSNLGFLPQI